jgi:hypothetical protein
MQNIKQVFRNNGTTFPEEIQKFFTQENLRKVQSAGCRYRQMYSGFSTSMCFDGDEYYVHQFDEKGFVDYMTLIKEAHEEEEEQKKFQWQPVEMQLAKIPRSKEQVLLALNNPEKFQGFTFSFKYRGNDNSQYVGQILDDSVKVYWFGDSTDFNISETLKQNIKYDTWVIDEPSEG